MAVNPRPGYCKRGPESFAEAAKFLACWGVCKLIEQVMPDSHPLRGSKFKVPIALCFFRVPEAQLDLQANTRKIASTSAVLFRYAPGSPSSSLLSSG